VIIDASAVLSILFRAPGYEALLAKVAAASRVGLGAPTLAELGIVLCAQTKRDARALLTRFVQQSEAQTVAFGESHGRVALDAYLRYGKGRHAADLSYAECLSYAVARLANEPLLTASPGFAHTDLELA
jgi:ribonuclease VapC